MIFNVLYLRYVGIGCGAFLSYGLNELAGRRLSIICGCFVNLCGTIALSCIASNAYHFFFYPGFICLSLSIGILLPTILLYVIEISTFELKSKAILIVVFGYFIGLLIGCVQNAAATGALGWLWQLFWSSLFIALLMPAIASFPESPNWILKTYGEEECEYALAILRRKQDVEEELKQLKDDQALESSQIVIKFILLCCLQFFMATSTIGLNSYLLGYFNAESSGSQMMSNALAVQVVGIFIAFFLVDRVSHKTNLLFTLTLLMALFILLGLNPMLKIWSNAGTMDQICFILIYIIAGLGPVAFSWITAIQIFQPFQRNFFLSFGFVCYFGFQPALLYLKDSYEDSFHYLFYLAAGLAFLILIILLTGFTSRKTGEICTRSELKDEKQKAKLLQQQLRQTPNSRSRSFNRSRLSARSGYQVIESPANVAIAP